ncbi:hypothetical protein CDD83_10980 [Cordyceps sp. RAO-2017]|nr:hypothetical protein CDD83_10980 [Cordyceps sp. RAO-2017]
MAKTLGDSPLRWPPASAPSTGNGPSQNPRRHLEFGSGRDRWSKAVAVVRSRLVVRRYVIDRPSLDLSFQTHPGNGHVQPTGPSWRRGRQGPRGNDKRRRPDGPTRRDYGNWERSRMARSKEAFRGYTTSVSIEPWLAG